MAAPYRPEPPPSRGFLNDLFPVDPRQVVGGLYDLGARGVGHTIDYATGAPSSGDDFSQPTLGREAYQMLTSPTFGGGMSPAAGMTLAAAPLALTAKVAKGARVAKAAEETAQTARAASPLDAISAEARAASATPTVADTIAAQAQTAVPPIVAYHGSPYAFDRFDISKIGTGEGAQAYGHGLYFAENEDVAKQYRDQLAQGFVDKQGAPLPDETQRALEYIHPKFKASGDYAAGLQDAISRMQDQADFYRRQYGPGPNLYDSAAERLKAVDPNNLKPAGSMYQVNINADPERFIDWDKPMNEQHPDVQAVLGSSNETAAGQLGRAYRNPMFAGDLIGQDRATPDELSAGLASKGIPGIKYLDQSSRAYGTPVSIAQEDGGQWKVTSKDPSGVTTNMRFGTEQEARDFAAKTAQPTHNYVTFSDDFINILRKYGLTGLGLTAGAGALATQRPSTAEAAPPQPIGSSPQYDDWWRQLQGQRFAAAAQGS